MLADQTFFKANDTSNVFAPQFKPSAANAGFQGNVFVSPFVPSMPQRYTKPA